MFTQIRIRFACSAFVAAISVGIAAPLAAQQAQAAGKNAVAVAGGRDAYYNDVEAIRKALSPEIKKQLDALLPSLQAQGKLFESLLAHLARKNGQEHAGISRQLAEILRSVQQGQVDAELKSWIERAKALESTLQGPDKAPALELLRRSDLDGAQRELERLRVQQIDSTESLRKQSEDMQRALVERRADTAQTDYPIGLIRYMKFDFEQAAQHFAAAVREYRKLRNEGHLEYNPQRADALHWLGAAYGELGRREEAVRANEVSVAIHRALAQTDGETYAPKLAGSLSNLGVSLGAVGDHDGALKAAREASDIYRKLAAARPDDFLPDLAGSLNNLGIMLSHAGDRDGALNAAREATDIDRKLAAARPDAFLPDLASSLNNLGNRLGEVGDRDGALKAAREASDIDRKLATAQPDAFLPKLASSLTTSAVGSGTSATATAH